MALFIKTSCSTFSWIFARNDILYWCPFCNHNTNHFQPPGLCCSILMMFSFTLIKEPCPAWLSFLLPRWRGTHPPSLHRITHASSDFAGWGAVVPLARNPSASPLPNLVLLSACPWQHRDRALAALLAPWGRGHREAGLVAEEMRHLHWPRCCTGAGKAKTNSDTAHPTLLRHRRPSSSLGPLLWFVFLFILKILTRLPF